MSLIEILALYPPVAYVVCVRSGRTHIEGIEDPHGHPEPPSDRILTDFFVPYAQYKF